LEIGLGEGSTSLGELGGQLGGQGLGGNIAVLLVGHLLHLRLRLILLNGILLAFLALGAKHKMIITMITMSKDV